MSEPISTDESQSRNPLERDILHKNDQFRPASLQKHGMRKRGLSRRHFLKLGAAGAATIAADSTLKSLGIDQTNTHTAHAASLHNTQQLANGAEKTLSAETSLDTNSLAELAKRANKTVGVEFTGWSFNNPKWREIVNQEFNVGVLTHGFHWNDIEPQQGQLDFTIADKLVQFGKENNMKLRAQALLWPSANFLPGWLKNGNFSASEMEGIIRQHISTIMKRYNGELDPKLKIDEWVVVNEPYKAPLRIRQEDVFYDALGKDYVRIAFEEARKNAPDAKLILNDNSNHSSSEFNFVNLDKEMIQMLRSAGLVDNNFALGIQGHIKGSTSPPSDITNTLKSYGVNLILTECDIDMSGVPGTPEQRNSIQSEKLTQFLEAIEASGTCNDYTFWGIGDKNSWLEKGGKPDADPTIYDDDFNPKPAVKATKNFFANILA